jgi:hypothetical protein
MRDMKAGDGCSDVPTGWMWCSPDIIYRTIREGSFNERVLDEIDCASPTQCLRLGNRAIIFSSVHHRLSHGKPPFRSDAVWLNEHDNISGSHRPMALGIVTG